MKLHRAIVAHTPLTGKIEKEVQMVRWRALAAALMLVLPGVLPLCAQETDDRVVILARHAEKQDGDDPGLTAGGQARAETLAHVLSRWPVDAIYTSQFRRTRHTAVPLAEGTGVVAEVVDARDMDALLETIHASEDRAIVVIGHSNTVPAIARALGAPGVEDIPEEGYDDLLIVHLPATGQPTLLHLKYGAPTPY